MNLRGPLIENGAGSSNGFRWRGRTVVAGKLDTLAAEALAEYHAGKATEI